MSVPQPIWKRAQVQELSKSLLSIRGDEGQGLAAFEDFWTMLIIVNFNAVECLKNAKMTIDILTIA